MFSSVIMFVLFKAIICDLTGLAGSNYIASAGTTCYVHTQAVQYVG